MYNVGDKVYVIDHLHDMDMLDDGTYFLLERYIDVPLLIVNKLYNKGKTFYYAQTLDYPYETVMLKENTIKCKI